MIVSRSFLWFFSRLLMLLGVVLGLIFTLSRSLPAGSILTYYAYFEDAGAIFMLDRGISVPIFKIPASFVSMAWSPDAETIAYITYEEDAYYLNTVAADGSRAQRLTEQTASGKEPTWSPDSTMIAFEALLVPNSQLFLVNANGGRLRDFMGSGSSRDLVWSPDGTEVALASWVNGTSAFEIFTMNAEACLSGIAICSPKRITVNSADDRLPTWSPDGSQLAFLSNRDGDWEIYALNSDCNTCEQATRQLTNMGVSANTALNWSPDGRWIAFVVSPLNQGSLIYLLDTTCTAPAACVTLISNHEIAAHGPEWSPDGKQIAYYSDTRIMLLDIACVTTSDGCVGKERPMTPPQMTAYYPVWRPN